MWYSVWKLSDCAMVDYHGLDVWNVKTKDDAAWMKRCTMMELMRY